MRSHKDLTEEEKNEYASLLSRSLKVAMEIKKLSTSKNVFEAVLIGIAANISVLETKSADDINRLYKDVEGDVNFSEETLKEGLGSLEKVKNRINAAKKYLLMVNYTDIEAKLQRLDTEYNNSILDPDLPIFIPN